MFGAYTSHFSQHDALLRPPKKRLFSGSLYLARASLEATKVDEKKSGQLHSMLFSLSWANSQKGNCPQLLSLEWTINKVYCFWMNQPKFHSYDFLFVLLIKRYEFSLILLQTMNTQTRTEVTPNDFMSLQIRNRKWRINSPMKRPL